MLTVAKIKPVVSRLAREYGAERVFLFGSYARGDATDESDIDLRIDKGRIRGIEFGGVHADLERALGASVDLVPTTSLSQDFLNKARSQEVLLYEA